MSTAGLAVICSLAVTFTAQPLLLRYLGQRVLDNPNSRSSHVVPTPRVGGVGVLFGLLPALAFGAQVPVIAGLLLGLVGFRDDVRSVSARLRLVLQLAVVSAATLVVAGGQHSVLLAVLVLSAVGYINAFNFMDGVNGISALNVMVVGTTYLTVGAAFNSSVVVGVGAVLMGTALGFLPFNLAGRVFLGDVGSYAYGGIIAITAVAGIDAGVPMAALLGPLAIYFADTGFTLLRRAFHRENVLAPHRDHVYQRLTLIGYPHFSVAIVSALFAGLTGVSGWLIAKGAEIGWILAIASIGLYLALPSLLVRTGNREGAI